MDSNPSATPALDAWRRRIQVWAELWGVPGLESRLRLETSTRMTRALGRCFPQSNHIRIAAFLLDGPRELLEEVICHEAAHAANWELHGRAARPHGPEWRRLMALAGIPARLRIPLPEDLVRQQARRKRSGWEHSCKRCGVLRVAGRPVRQWRCKRCWDRGRPGKLSIRKIEASG